MAAAPVQLEIRDTIAQCILSNPPKNEMNMDFFKELTRLRTEIFPTLNVSAMLLYGKGNHFSSGADLEELRAMYKNTSFNGQTSFLADNLETFRAITLLPFPVAAVINGCCIGAGLELALACKYRIASLHAVFSLPETTFDLIPGCGGTVRLPKLISKGKAVEMILSGRTVSAEEALEIGLVDACFERKSLMDDAVAFVTSLQTAARKIPDRRYCA